MMVDLHASPLVVLHSFSFFGGFACLLLQCVDLHARSSSVNIKLAAEVSPLDGSARFFFAGACRSACISLVELHASISWCICRLRLWWIYRLLLWWICTLLLCCDLQASPLVELHAFFFGVSAGFTLWWIYRLLLLVDLHAWARFFIKVPTVTTGSLPMSSTRVLERRAAEMLTHL